MRATILVSEPFELACPRPADAVELALPGHWRRPPQGGSRAAAQGKHDVHQPQPMCSGRYTSIPTTMVPRMPRRQK
ncbi:hypothetical protein CBP36_18480 [Acidovorax carolinensis]|uniref:Uncharacterized protein n=1 Tax=Acidovorax carolinensis TaxID=553814 RepID=A0A240UHL2_9BURK|nr:hypothetical protein CBP36_18480 [Acidovorax carolinensis]